MPLRKDLSQQKFGRLLVVEYAGKSTYRHSLWNCLCDCGNTVKVMGKYLFSGKTQSCGCFRRERISELHSTHGNSATSLYGIWCCIKTRCYNKNSDHYKYYGARNITLCDEWQEFETFKQWALSNGYEEGLTIDRLDSTKAYTPDNCQFLSRSENSKKSATERWSKRSE